MSLKKIINNNIVDDKKIIQERYNASKFIFIIISFLFFLNFYFVGARFYSEIFVQTLSIMYILVNISIIFLFYFFIKKALINKVKRHFFIIPISILLIILLTLLTPVMFSEGFNKIFKLYELYF